MPALFTSRSSGADVSRPALDVLLPRDVADERAAADLVRDGLHLVRACAR